MPPINVKHRIIREMLGRMPLPEAKTILETNLPYREFASIYFSRDVANEKDLNFIADMLNTTESNVKKIRKSGYEKLAALYFPSK